MKRKLVLLAVTLVFATAASYGQAASATWGLTADTSVVVSGNVTAPVQFLSKTAVVSDTLSVRDYAGGTPTSGSPVGIAERMWCNGTNWPKESAQQDGRYIQFSISPSSNNKLTVTSISFNIGGYGGAYIFANIYYSTDPTFATKTQVASAFNLPDARTVAMSAMSYTPSVLVDTGKTFYLRIYPYYNSTSSPTKYILLTNVVIAGTAAVVGTPSVAVGPSSLSFGTINETWTKNLSFTLSGTLLNPTADSVRITAPAGFSLSTTLGNGYSSYLALPYSGSTLNLSTVYVQFSPSTIKTYNDSITISGGGAAAQSLYVNGTAADPSTILGIFVATTGSDSSAGTFAAPYLTIQKAISGVNPGDSIFVRAGTYVNNKTISISKNGTATNFIALYAYPPDNSRPLLDFSSMVYGSSNRGIVLSGSYWHIKGLDVYKAGDNGMFTSGSHNIVEFCAFHENRDGGCQIGSGGAYNQFINCDSYFNFDDSTTTNGVVTPGGNADGFSPKLDMGTGNSFYGCRSWQNSDDGWDGFQETVNDDTTYLINCWTWKNGYLKDGVTRYPTMNGNGFKMGGNSMVHNFIVHNCLSFDNYAKGFDQNNGTGSLTILNCTAFRNNGSGGSSRDFSIPGSMAAGKQLILENCISYTNYVTTSGPATQTIAACSWTGGFTTPSSSDFLSIDTTGVSGPRKPDGSLPDITFMHLASASQFVNRGTDVGLAYIGTAPDVGCFETSVLSDVAPLSSGRITEYQLHQNYPNPFNPTTMISYQIAKSGLVTLKIYDLLGREISMLVNANQSPGVYQVTFDASRLPSGMYFYRLQTGSFTEVKKMMFIK